MHNKIATILGVTFDLKSKKLTNFYQLNEQITTAVLNIGRRYNT